MTMPGADVDVDSVWVLADACSRTLSPESAEFFSRWAGMGVAAALDHWWFDPLREEPRYKTLAGT